MRAADLTDLALAWAVATCEGWTNLRVYAPPNPFGDVYPYLIMDYTRDDGKVTREALEDLGFLDWADAGEIIEREKIAIMPQEDGGWFALHDSLSKASGPTAIIAAMRCYCLSKLGAEITLPKELK